MACRLGIDAADGDHGGAFEAIRAAIRAAPFRSAGDPARLGPHGEMLADAGGEPGLVVATMDRDDPALHVALDLARPWRATARAGEIYEERRVRDERSRVRTEF